MCRSDRCRDPVGTEGGAPTGSRSKLRLKPLSKRSSFGRLLLDQLHVVLLGGLHDTLPRGPPSAEGGYKRAVLAAQYDYVWVRLVHVVVELGEHLHLHAHLLRTSPFLRVDSLLRFLPSTYVSAWK